MFLGDSYVYKEIKKLPMKTFTEKVTWVDILSPTPLDIAFLKKEHRFHPIILDELLTQSARARVERYDDYLYLTYHLPIYDPRLKTSRKGEIDFLITPHTVYTIHYEALEPLDTTMGLIEARAEFRERILGYTTAELVYHLIESIIAFSERQLRHIEENIHAASLDVFRGRERELLERISYVKRDLLDYHLIARPQKIVLSSLNSAGIDFWGPRAKVFLDDLMGDEMKVREHIESYLGVIESLDATNAQLLNAKMNRSMQIFTILAFFTFPLVLFTSVYSVEHRPAEFWFGFGAIALITATLPLIFLRKDIF
ncbi:MAG: CorA family divalent cation transporter [Patescibacteria group bacterium]